MARYRRSRKSRNRSSARRVSRRARRHQSRLGLRMGRGGFRKGRRKGRVHAKWSTVKRYRRMAHNPAQFPAPFVSALNPGKRRGRKSRRRSSKSSRRSWVKRSKRQEKWARKKARWYQGRHRAKSRRGGNSKRALNRALYYARGGRFARSNCGR